MGGLVGHPSDYLMVKGSRIAHTTIAYPTGLKVDNMLYNPTLPLKLKSYYEYLQ